MQYRCPQLSNQANVIFLLRFIGDDVVMESSCNFPLMFTQLGRPSVVFNILKKTHKLTAEAVGKASREFGFWWWQTVAVAAMLMFFLPSLLNSATKWWQRFLLQCNHRELRMLQPFCMKIIEYIEYLAIKCVCASPQLTREVFALPC